MKPTRCVQLLHLMLLCLSLRLLRLQAKRHNQDKFLEMKSGQLVDKFSNALNLILLHTCAAHNMSIFLTTYYRQHLTLEQQRLVKDALALATERHDKNLMIPVVMDKHLELELSIQTQMVLAFIQNSNQLIKMARVKQETNSRHDHKILIVLMVRATLNANREMEKIFDYFLHERYNIDVFLLLADTKHSTLDTYSFWPYRSAVTQRPEQRCESTQPVAVPLLDAHLRQLYPNKLINLFGCPLHVVVWQVAPFMELYSKHGEVIDAIDGLDATLLKLLAKKLNFSLSLMWNEPRELLGGASFINGTMSGAFQMLLTKRANMTLGNSACLPALSQHLSSTQPYAQSQYAIIMRAGSPYSAYEIMFFPYDNCTWLLLLASIFAVYVLRQFQDWFLMPPVLLGWTILLFTMRIGYESSVFKFVHDAPTKPLPHSLDQALAQGYSFITDYVSYRITEDMPMLRQKVRALPCEPAEIFKHLLDLPQESRTAVFTTQVFLAYYLSQHREQQQQFVLSRKPVVDVMICVHFTPSSYMTKVINELLFHMRSHGIFQHLGKRLGLEYLLKMKRRPMRQHAPAKSRETNITKFKKSMHFIYAALGYLIIIEMLTICVFALEVISQRQLPYTSSLAWIFQHL